MLIKLLKSYSLKLFFAATLLFGLQLPNFLQQYEQRLDAHLIEANIQLKQYQALADIYFSGNLSALINKHKQSDVQLFVDEAQVIESLLSRFHYLQAQQIALQGPLIARFYFLFAELNKPLLLETKENYNAEIVSNQHSITVGLVVALFSTLLLELFFLYIIYLLKRRCLAFGLQAKIK